MLRIKFKRNKNEVKIIKTAEAIANLDFERQKSEK